MSSIPDALRIETPRLELRLATKRELQKLFRVAEAGIHDPGFMPFAVAWTDNLDEAGFLTYHRDTLAAWRPDEWRLNLITFLDGDPIGSQGLVAANFPAERTATTGSWLGQAFQGRGLGAEMRSGVLSFAFDALGAERVLSGALVGNERSLGVSRKLGYRAIGSHFVSPRGEPAEHTDLELARAGFRPLVEVSWTGFDPAPFGL
ncbi:MAG TPA: GNAT family N-acetyltransferase [Gaiellaceae bacterium]